MKENGIKSRKSYSKPDITELGKIANFVLGCGGTHPDNCHVSTVSTHKDDGQGTCPPKYPCS